MRRIINGRPYLQIKPIYISEVKSVPEGTIFMTTDFVEDNKQTEFFNMYFHSESEMTNWLESHIPEFNFEMGDNRYFRILGEL